MTLYIAILADGTKVKASSLSEVVKRATKRVSKKGNGRGVFGVEIAGQAGRFYKVSAATAYPISARAAALEIAMKG